MKIYLDWWIVSKYANMNKDVKENKIRKSPVLSKGIQFLGDYKSNKHHNKDLIFIQKYD